ncbi:SusC/RagA family TonB-linked outer membrane protein [Parapedobacter pyrenivorans]|uniref:SusC/RagA family TonB-linked outer membrane protein n=1 Tax=Parapedobacter pyrenivorans TaxID=1305674 RepID=UPI003342DDDF
MKLSVLLTVITVLQVTASSLAQTISLTATNRPLAEVMEEVKKQSGYHFFIAGNQLANTTISASIKGARLEEAMDALTSNLGVEWIIKKKVIVLRRVALRPKLVQPIINLPVLQERVVTGKITDNQGTPLAGVTVSIKGSSTVVTTDNSGVYQITVSADNTTLVYSNVGFQTNEVLVGTQSTINVNMITSISDLDEVVVVGYGTQKREHITTAISSVKAKDFAKGANQDAAQLIRGKVPGLAVVRTDGNPLSGSQIKLRGTTTINGDASPLVLVDGVPGSLLSVSPGDIESIDVLKDGSAAAIYGTRGTNGVILITTRKVRGETPPTIDLDSYVSTEQLMRSVEMLTADEYRELVKQNKPGAFDYGASTNWLNRVTQTPFSQVHNVSLKGGTKNTSYVVSLESRDLNGIMRKSNSKYVFPRVNVSHRMFDGKIRIDASIFGNQQTNFAFDGNQYQGLIYRNAIAYNPTAPLRFEDGRWFEQPEKPDYRNPVAWIEESIGKTKNSRWHSTGSVTFNPINGLDITALYSNQVFNQTAGYYEKSGLWWTPREGYAARGTGRGQDDLFEFTANYNRSISEHDFTVLGGYTWRQINSENYWMQNWDFPTDDFLYNNMAAGAALRDGRANLSSSQSESKLVGYFARLNYSFRNRYLMMASIRYEGSSKFGSNHKWGSFPAVSVGWNVHNEPFFASLPVIDVLKLRAGYGITGTEPNASYISLSRINFDTKVLMDGEWIQAVNPSNNPNPNLRWETKRELNIGMDYAMLSNRISGSVDYYVRTTNDLIANFPVPTPPYLYSTVISNAASMRNTGVEIQINAIPFRSKSFEWHTSASYYTNANKVLTLSNDRFSIASGYFDTGHTGEPLQQITHRVQLGQPIGNFFGFKSIDVDDNGYWIIEDSEGNPKSNLDQTPADKKIIGNGLPKSYLNWNNTFTYKNLDLSILMRGAFNFQILNMTEMFYSVPVFLTRGNLRANAYDDVFGKRPLADDQSLQYVSYFLEDGDHWKIDNVTLGYNLDEIKSKYLKGARIYLSVNNLYTITGYKGVDPEVSMDGLNPGVDPHNRYPSVTSYTVGVSLKF